MTFLLALAIAVPLLAQDAEGNPPAEFDKYWWWTAADAMSFAEPPE